MGGRYHTIQVHLSGQGILGSSSPDDIMESSGIGVEMDSLRALLIILLVGRSFLSMGVFGTLVVENVAAVLKSKAVPGVFGVLVADPNDANAPEPRPNADDPPVVGEVKPPVFNGATPLKGFLPPCDESPLPNLFAEENVRCGCSVFSFCCSECDMESESLLVLV